jgi:hypothetical protein
MIKNITPLLIAICLLFISCSQTEISREKFIDLLVDIHLADGYLSNQGYRIDAERGKINEGYTYILNKHQVTQKQFINTLEYYSRHTEQYDEIYNQVIEKLTRLETENTGQKINKDIKKTGVGK